jgi:hypothetical protein
VLRLSRHTLTGREPALSFAEGSPYDIHVVRRVRAPELREDLQHPPYPVLLPPGEGVRLAVTRKSYLPLNRGVRFSINVRTPLLRHDLMIRSLLKHSAIGGLYLNFEQ